MPEPVFIVGCGYLGYRVARLWRGQDARVTALARSEESAEALALDEVTAVRGDLDDPASLIGLPVGRTVVYYFAPPPPEGETDPRMRTFVEALSRRPHPSRVVYLSTSGVYGDRGGGWVDEQAGLRPASDRARRRLDAENTLRQWGRRENVPVMVLRTGGIYGPGRLPVDRIRKRLPVLNERESPYTNRIHVDDLARACVEVAVRGSADTVYNVSDGKPGTMTEYFFAVADRLHLPRPDAVSMEEARRVMTPGMLSYLGESRRLDTRRIRDELGFEPQYPDLESGLRQVFPDRDGPD